MQQLNHPNIVKIIDWFFQSKSSDNHGSMNSNLSNIQEEKIPNLFMVMPLCLRLDKLKDFLEKFDENDFKSMFKQILKGMDFLHQNYIIHRVSILSTFFLVLPFWSSLATAFFHCFMIFLSLFFVGLLRLSKDVKMENFLIDSNRKIVLADFGLSRECGSLERRLTSNTFTLEYRSPEIILGSTLYGVKSDMWAIGVVMVELLMRLESLFFMGEVRDD